MGWVSCGGWLELELLKWVGAVWSGVFMIFEELLVRDWLDDCIAISG